MGAFFAPADKKVHCNDLTLKVAVYNCMWQKKNILFDYVMTLYSIVIVLCV